MRRREFLIALLGVAEAGIAGRGRVCWADEGYNYEERARQYLRRIIPTRDQVERFVQCGGPEGGLSRNMGWLFDSELGWVLCNSIRPYSVDGSKGFYSYEPDGARRVVNFPDRPCRIHTYGNSFTHCDQVSDGETWQEFLAAHLQEPIRNYGIGGYSVYQAYLRMLRVEAKYPAEYIILNIWDDDHYRNLDSWRAIRFGARTPCGFTLPYLQVGVSRGLCMRMPNLCSSASEVYRLCDEEFVWKHFGTDPVLKLMLAKSAKRDTAEVLIREAAEAFGIPEDSYASMEPAQAIQKVHTEAALFATKQVIRWTEEFIQKTGKKFMLILSFSQHNIARELRALPRFDQSFVDWLRNKPYPVIDMRDAFRSDYQTCKTSPEDYLKRYYIGHHTPAGNFFTAWALKRHVVDWLQPRPAPYR